MMNLIRLYNVASLRSCGEASQRILPGERAWWHTIPSPRGGINESGPASARYSEALAGHYVMLEGGMVRRVMDMQARGGLGGEISRYSDVSPKAGIQTFSLRIRSPHRSDDPQVAQTAESKGGRKVDTIQPMTTDKGKGDDRRIRACTRATVWRSEICC